jgi:Na+:H+ antiporter, NhaA family
MNMRKANLFKEFISSERAGGFVLLACTFFSLAAANIFPVYSTLWHWEIAHHSIAHWVNDGLMAIFFLLVGLELEREIYIGELSTLKKASLPAIAALGGMIFPAGLYLLLNASDGDTLGAGIPIATDIAFALGILSLVGKRIPISLRIFLTALAVIDDLGAILVIAFFYTNTLDWVSLGTALGIFAFMLVLNRFNVHVLWLYLLLGIVMWYFMLYSGVHASISGVLLAFAIPFGKGNSQSISFKLQHALHYPVAFVILPIFALANTAIVIDTSFVTFLSTSISLGILTGLIIGKPTGIFLFSYFATKLNLSELPKDIRWVHVLGIGILGGIGFTMSIFIAILSFSDPAMVDQSKVVVIIASVVSGVVGYLLLRRVVK